MPYPPIIEAKEILRRSEKGTLKPFFVRDTRDELYVVKGVDGAGRQALVAELICSELGKRCGLPVAEYALMEFPHGMLEFSTEPGATDLNGGVAYASKVVPYCQELTFTQVEQVPVELQQLVLLFDIWVSNEDRYLSNLGGNVNLLQGQDGTKVGGKLVVIDHNLAFSPMAGIGDFSSHVFSAQRPALRDLEVQSRYQEMLDIALADWSTIVSFLPEEWIYRDPDDKSTALTPTLEERYAWLARLRKSSFWSDI
ncbi:HipA family kinase [Vreelandella titanicae]|uniref:HipA family kinase n=1 Tax=Vreelandella titanicae TaxID=664683 RepID=UPI003985E1E6